VRKKKKVRQRLAAHKKNEERDGGKRNTVKLANVGDEEGHRREGKIAELCCLKAQQLYTDVGFPHEKEGNRREGCTRSYSLDYAGRPRGERIL